MREPAQILCPSMSCRVEFGCMGGWGMYCQVCQGICLADQETSTDRKGFQHRNILHKKVRQIFGPISGWYTLYSYTENIERVECMCQEEKRKYIA